MEESKNKNEDFLNELLPCYENSITFDNPEPLFKCHFMKHFLFYKITFHIRNYTETVWKKGWILKSEINKEKSITTTSHILSNDIEKDDIKASFKHGILHLDIPKKQPKPQVEENKFISIEG